MRPFFVGLAVSAVLLTACGSTTESDVASGSSPESLSDVEQDFFDLLVDLGATEQEASCLARSLAGDADTFDEANDRTAGYESFGEALIALAPDCGSAERYTELDGLYEAFVESELAGAEEARRAIYEPGLTAAGASQAEVECMTDVLIATPPEKTPPLYGSYETGDSELAIFDGCGSPERIAELYRESYRAPLRSRIVASGVTATEADCIIDSIDQVDLFLPSDDFHGDTETEMTADVFVEDALHCATEERLRETASELHRLYEEAN